MPRSTPSLPTSAAWLEALRAFTSFAQSRQRGNTTTTTTGASSFSPLSSSSSATQPPSTPNLCPDLSARLALYELVARAHLFGPPGFRVAPAGLRAVRQTRWDLLSLGGGSPASKGVLIERILRLYSDAARAALYDPVPSTAERQALLLEQVQCLVEAKVAGMPLTARHYRYPLQSPQLSAVGADLPLVLLSELEECMAAAGNSDSCSSGTSRELAAAQLDCAVGLASSGHTAAALRLCTAADPLGFPYVIRQVADMRRDGWRQAWALADAVPLATLTSGRAEDAGWLAGLLDAGRRRFQASGDPAVHEWLRGFMLVWEEGKEGTSKGEEGSAASGRRRVPVRVIETYLAVCPADAWREATALVASHNSTVNDSRSGGERVGVGRLMTLLSLAGQPREILRLFYGSSFSPDFIVADGQAQGPPPAATVRRALVQLPSGPSEEFLSAEDRQHAATHNHAMMTLAHLGLWREAVRFHAAIPTVCVNRHTHWSAARMLLVVDVPSGSRQSHHHQDSSRGQEVRVVVPEYLKEDAVFDFARGCLHRAWLSPAAATAATADARGTGKGLPDTEAVLEGFALWAAARRDWAEVAWLSRNAPGSCRYVKLIAIASLLRFFGAQEVQPLEAATLVTFPAFTPGDAGPGEAHRPTPQSDINKDVDEGGIPATPPAVEFARQLDALLSSPDASLKQVCLATAFIANSSAAVTLLGASRTNEGELEDLDNDAHAVLSPAVVDGIVRVMGRSIAGSQSAADHAITVFVDQFLSLRQRQRKHSRSSGGSRTVSEAEMLPSLVRSRVLPEVMDLARGIDGNAEDGWRVVLQVLRALAEAQDVSIARAAPAMVSAGMSPEVAIKFLDA